MIGAALLAALTVASPIQVSLSVEPQSAFLGDPIELEALVLAPDPEAVRVDARLAPLRELGPRRIEREGALVRVRIRASCTDAACLDRLVVLPKLRVRAQGSVVERAWPTLRVGARTPRVISGQAPWRLDDLRPPPVSYRVRPGALEVGFAGLAAVLAALGVALLAFEVRAATASRSRRALTPLERALRAARAALRGDEAARRRALGALARVVGIETLARRAQAAAWAGEPPSPEQVEALARAAERETRR